jgi:hypothetical protein
MDLPDDSFEVTKKWVSVVGTDKEVPPNSVKGGLEKKTLYVCRDSHEGQLTPGKIVPSDGYCYISWGGKELRIREYEVRGCVR